MASPLPTASIEADLKQFCPELIHDVRVLSDRDSMATVGIVPRLSVCRYLLDEKDPPEVAILGSRRVQGAIANCLSDFNRAFDGRHARVAHCRLMQRGEMGQPSDLPPERRGRQPTFKVYDKGQEYLLWNVPPA